MQPGGQCGFRTVWCGGQVADRESRVPPRKVRSDNVESPNGSPQPNAGVQGRVIVRQDVRIMDSF